jgi:AcrR family transcriptional regulator
MSKGTDTRDAILTEGMRLASMKGLEGLTIGSLAGELGLSKSGLFAHFKSKEHLQVTVVERAAQVFVEAVIVPALKAPRGLPRLEAIFENWLTWASRPVLPGGCLFVQAAAEFDDRPGPVRDAIKESQGAWIATLEKAVALAVAENHLHADTDPAQVAFELEGILLASQFADRLLDDPRVVAKARRAFSSLFERHGARSASMTVPR